MLLPLMQMLVTPADVLSTLPLPPATYLLPSLPLGSLPCVPSGACCPVFRCQVLDGMQD